MDTFYISVKKMILEIQNIIGIIGVATGIIIISLLLILLLGNPKLPGLIMA
jgi:hypothetical protein